MSSAIASGAAMVDPQHPALSFVAARVVKVHPYPTDVRIALNVACVRDTREFNHGRGREKLLDLKNRCEPALVHVDHYTSMINPIPLNR